MAIANERIVTVGKYEKVTQPDIKSDSPKLIDQTLSHALTRGWEDALPPQCTAPIIPHRDGSMAGNLPALSKVGCSTWNKLAASNRNHKRQFQRAVTHNTREDVKKRRSYNIDYTKSDGTRTVRRIDPLAIKGKLMHAFDHHRNEMRSFRLDRVNSMSKLAQGFIKQARELTAKGRKQINADNFVFPKERRYPIHDISHARNALARVSQHGTPEEISAVRRAVSQKYPSLEK